MINICLIIIFPAGANGFQWSGYISTESRIFPQTPISPIQHGNNVSFSFQPEYYQEWADGHQGITFVPFFRFDQNDNERTHLDIRELYWHMVSNIWELRIGIRKLFWGVTESQHLVDIINQTDLVENLDTEDKLGQPMMNIALISNWGTFDFFILPGFRERTFPGSKGRLRNSLPLAENKPVYESSAENRHIDWAVRSSHAVGSFDFGISHFYGTSREPRLLPGIDDSGLPILIPRYDLIHQTGLDIQATWGGWLWKLEAILRSGQGNRFYAMTGGFEYTFVNIKRTGADIGILAEYLYDDRRDLAPVIFEDDYFIATRLVLNDIHSTELLAGFIFDRDTKGRMLNIEGSRRLGENWKLNLEIRRFIGISSKDLLYSIRKDDYIQFEFARYF